MWPEGKSRSGYYLPEMRVVTVLKHGATVSSSEKPGKGLPLLQEKGSRPAELHGFRRALKRKRSRSETLAEPLRNAAEEVPEHGRSRG